MPTSVKTTIAIICLIASVTGLVVFGTAPLAHARTAWPATSPAAASPTPQPAASPTAGNPTPTDSATSAPSSPIPNPAPAPAPTPPDSGTDAGGCGMFDMTCRAGHAIDAWFRGLVTSAINPVFTMVGTSLLTTPRLDQMPRVRGLWTASLAIANSCFVLLAVIGALIVMGYQTVQTSYTIKEILPRMVIAVVTANISLLLIGHAIDLANALSVALLGQGVDPAAAAAQLKKIILHAISPGDVGVFFILVVFAAVLLGTILTVIFMARMLLTILLISAAPLALACHALPGTENLAKLWWRALAGVLAIQIAQALVFVSALKVALTSDMVTIVGVRTPGDQMDLWIALCLLYVLVRIPSWVSRLVWQSGLGGSPIVRTAKTIAMLVLFRSLLGHSGGRRHAATMTGRPPREPGEFFATRPPPANPGTARWAQPPLPFERPSPRGTQLPLPFDRPTSTARPRHIQLPLPLHDQPQSTPRWEQTQLPIRIRHEQLSLPLQLPPQHVQPQLPITFPERGSPAAGTPRPVNPVAEQHTAQLWARERERRIREQLRRDQYEQFQRQQAAARRTRRRPRN
jgi:hypothetical protein